MAGTVATSHTARGRVPREDRTFPAALSFCSLHGADVLVPDGPRRIKGPAKAGGKSCARASASRPQELLRAEW